MSLGLSIIEVRAQDKSCQLAMCVMAGGSVAVSVGDGSSAASGEVQSYVVSKCPGATNILLNVTEEMECGDNSLLSVCKIGIDPNYPFNTPTPTNIPAPQMNPNSPQSNNCSYGSTCINNYRSQANQIDARFYFLEDLDNEDELNDFIQYLEDEKDYYRKEIAQKHFYDT
ncbi:241_t:CDS:2, partial [Gigaspora margarita]